VVIEVFVLELFFITIDVQERIFAIKRIPRSRRILLIGWKKGHQSRETDSRDV
jgi:hypothetical protein